MKAKLASGINDVPGGLSYKRTRPDRCYADPAVLGGGGRPTGRPPLALGSRTRARWTHALQAFGAQSVCDASSASTSRRRYRR